jgi:hypothetical protein
VTPQTLPLGTHLTLRTHLASRPECYSTHNGLLARPRGITRLKHSSHHVCLKQQHGCVWTDNYAQHRHSEGLVLRCLQQSTTIRLQQQAVTVASPVRQAPHCFTPHCHMQANHSCSLTTPAGQRSPQGIICFFLCGGCIIFTTKKALTHDSECGTTVQQLQAAGGKKACSEGKDTYCRQLAIYSTRLLPLPSWRTKGDSCPRLQAHTNTYQLHMHQTTCGRSHRLPRKQTLFCFCVPWACTIGHISKLAIPAAAEQLATAPYATAHPTPGLTHHLCCN